MGRRMLAAAALAVLAGSFAGCKGMSRGEVQTADDAAFMRTAAEGNLAEVEMGRIAVQRASRDDVRQFGQRMIDDHGRANTRLVQLADTKSISLPDEPNLGQRMKADELRGKSGMDFDRAYVDTMVDDHQKDIDLYEKQVRDGKDAEVVAYARETLPALREHLQLAQQLAARVGTETR